MSGQQSNDCDELTKQSQDLFNYQVLYTIPPLSFNTNPFYQTKNTPSPRRLVENESDIKNLNRKLSECSSKQYPYNSNQGQMILPETKGLSSLFLSKDKACNSEIPLNRFDCLHENFNDPSKLHSNRYIGVNTRTLERDISPSPDMYKNTPKSSFASQGKYCQVSDRKGYNLNCLTFDKNAQGYSIMKPDYKPVKKQVKKTSPTKITLV